MKFTNKLTGAMVFGAMACNVAVADTIFNSSLLPGGGYNGNAFNMVSGQSIGNEVVLSSVWSLTNFTIQYNAPSAPASTIGIDLQIYANDGAGIPTSGYFPTPGTLIYDSGFYYGLLTTGQHAIYYNTSDFATSLAAWASPYNLPVDFTFVVTYTNSDGSGNLDGLQSPTASTPTGQPGSSYGDYWLSNPGGPWELLTNSSFAANLLVNIEGTPEPSVFWLGAIGGGLLLGVNKLRRKR